MSDDWAAFNPQPAPDADPWAEFHPQAATQEAAPESPSPWAGVNDAIPEAFMDRVHWGQAIGRIAAAAGKDASEVTGTTPTGFSDEMLNGLIDRGWFHDPLREKAGPVQLLIEGVAMPAAQGWQAFGAGLGALVRAAGGAAGQLADEFGESQGMSQRAKNEASNLGNQLLIESGFGRFARLSIARDARAIDAANGPIGRVMDQTIGGLPRAEDFSNAAGALHEVGPGVATAEEVEQRIRALWQEKGIHPAEVANDAANDAFLKHDLTAEAADQSLSEDTIKALQEVGIDARPGSLGAAVTSDPPLIPPSVQPPTPPGTLTVRAQAAIEQLTGLAKNIQFMLDPMATGSDRAMVIAKDAINSVRRIRWDHARIDADIASRFTPEQREFMWRAADEESVLLQKGETSPDTGLLTLGADERAAVEEMHARAQSAWLHARDAGIVEGEGLPAYTPRMVINVANASDDLGPRALNELGRNVFTRTSQMLHRGNLTAEETEAAAQRLVQHKMEERGASPEEIAAAVEKVKIARDIRALPMATARLQEAAIWRDMINKIEDAGKATGEQTVAVGFKPDNSWFTISGHPSFTRWEPLLDRNPETGDWATRADENGNIIFQPKPIYMAPDFRGPMTAILDQSASNSKAVRVAMSGYEALMSIKGKAMTAILNSPLIHNQVVWGKVAEAAGGREWLGFGLYWRGNKIVNGSTGRAQELIERGLNPMGPRGSVQDITGIMEEPNLQPGRSLTAKALQLALGHLPQKGMTTAEVQAQLGRAIDKVGDVWHNTLLWDRVRDLQFGLADHLSDHIVAKGVDRLTADRVAAHFSNIIVGSIPKEAMSSAAAAIANGALFSRSFTLGNLSTFKQAIVGLPRPIMAQIERDFFDFRLNPETGTWEAPPTTTEQVQKIAQGLARRKAVATIGMSYLLSVVGTALFQHATNVVVRDATVNDELQGYARRYKSLMRDVGDDPHELRRMVARLSPTYDNEPNKQERVFLGNEANGTAAYMRMPFGKFGEEMVGYPTMPMQMLRQKLSPAAGFLLDVITNDDGLGQKIYDEKAPGLRGDVATAYAVAWHLLMKHMPENQIKGGVDLLRGDGDPTVNAARLVGPALGFTVSEGRQGGMAKGELGAVQDEAKARFSLAWPDIKKQILRGNEPEAKQAMAGLGISPREQNMLIRNAKNPSAISGRQALDFTRKATPEQQERFDRARGQ